MSHEPFEIAAFPGTVLYLSQEGARRAVVFVHGWKGDAVHTWSNFHKLIDLRNHRESWKDTDLYFFQYRSVWDHIQAAGDNLASLLRKIFPKPHADLFPTDYDMPNGVGLSQSEAVSLYTVLAEREYSSLILVGHSEGGVVLRTVIADIAEAHESTSTAVGSTTATNIGSTDGDLLTAQLRLFAPALFGYSPSRLIGTVVSLPFLSSLFDSFLRASPSYQDLHSPSEFLTDLRTRTESLAERHGYPALRARILWGRNEEVLKVRKYRQDVIAGHIDGRRHTDICKPSTDYELPLEFVAE